MRCKLLHDSIRICLWKITLVDCNNDWNLCGLGMVDCFQSLWHDAIICGNYKNHDIRYLSSSGTHHGKSGMTRSIQKYYISLAWDVHLVSTDMLCDSAELAFCDMSLSYC